MTTLKRFNGANFSGDCRNRFLLWRIWGKGPHLRWIMLNPSTANAVQDDPTLESCRRISEYREYGGLEVINLFAYMTSKPEELLHVATRDMAQAVGGDENDKCLVEVAKSSGDIVVAWGAWGNHEILKPRAEMVKAVLSKHHKAPIQCLDLPQAKDPRHPLYCPANTPFKPFV